MPRTTASEISQTTLNVPGRRRVSQQCAVALFQHDACEFLLSSVFFERDGLQPFRIITARGRIAVKNILVALLLMINEWVSYNS